MSTHDGRSFGVSTRLDANGARSFESSRLDLDPLRTVRCNREFRQEPVQTHTIRASHSQHTQRSFFSPDPGYFFARDRETIEGREEGRKLTNLVESSLER